MLRMKFPIKHILKGIGFGSAVAHELGLPVPDLQAAIDAVHTQGGRAGSVAASRAGDALLAAQVAALTQLVQQQSTQIAELLSSKGKA